MPMIYVNFYTNHSDITYELSNSPDLQKVKPIYCTEREIEDIKTMSVEKIFALIDNNKF